MCTAVECYFTVYGVCKSVSEFPPFSPGNQGSTVLLYILLGNYVYADLLLGVVHGL